MSKINANSINNYEAVNAARPNELQKSERESAVDNKTAIRGEDKIELSGRAEKIGELVDRIKELPDVRADKVNALRAKIEANQYHPTSDAIADAILKNET